MSSPDIGVLFDNERFPGGVGLLLVLLYTPIGILLALIRIFIGFHAFLISCLLPKMTTIRSVVLRCMCGVLGVLVTTEGMQNRDKKAKVLVANYTSTLDHLAVDLVVPTILPSVWDLPATLMWLLGYKDMGARDGRDTLIRNATKHIRDSPIPLLVFPEGASTNGKKGLLKFSVWPFSLEQPLQPVVISISRPQITNISPSILGGRWWIDVLWFLFVPYSLFHIKILPVEEEQEEETVEEFTKRVQGLMANAMGVSVTDFTSADKVDYTKKKLFINTRESAGSPSSTPSNGVEVMVYQVKEVLPHVPHSVIRADLALTKDVDLTITNILEGRVQYTEENTEQENQQTSQAPSLTVSDTTSFKDFLKKSSQRQASLEERKKALLEYARQKYKQKHGLL